MAINWFPGHMHKARKEIKKVMPQMDLQDGEGHMAP